MRFYDVFARWSDVLESFPLHISEHLPIQLEEVGVGSCRQFYTVQQRDVKHMMHTPAWIYL
jgi:hypothetical protein